MKTLVIALATAAASLAGTASAQVYYSRPYIADPYYAQTARECWNPRAGRFEEVRPGEYQDDLDPYRCRFIGEPYVERRVLREGQECWNYRARRFEEVRPGEYQDDLDYNRCRLNRYSRW
ncbi:MAG TPA: hypothetical protein VEC19_11120 [Usitatibacter sp.]|nr:hypothetical protein [Usitatibacter sp.]